MNIENLKKSGIDYEDGLHRFSGNANIYEKYLKKLIDITLIGEAKDYISKVNVQEAFDACHKLKAVVGNLSVPILYERVCTLTEILRSGEMEKESALERINEIEDIYNSVAECIKMEMKAEQ